MAEVKEYCCQSSSADAVQVLSSVVANLSHPPVSSSDTATAGKAEVTIAEPPAPPAPSEIVVDFSVMHPLHSTWCLWYDNPGKRVSQASWLDSIRMIATFDMVEDFWRLFNNVVPPSRLPSGSNYHIFKKGIEPKWEDPLNLRGGKWIVSVPKQNKAMMDDLWLSTILCVIGEMIDYGDEVCGAVVSMRKAQDRISLWTRSSSAEQLCMSIGRQFRAALNLPATWIVGYQAHADSQKRNSSFNSKNRYEC